MYLKKFFFVFFLLYPVVSNSDENIGKSKIFVEKLGKQVVEKVSNTEITAQERHNNFKKLYLTSFDNYYISRFVLGRYWKTIDKGIQKQFVDSQNIELHITSIYGHMKTHNKINKNGNNWKRFSKTENRPVVTSWPMYISKFQMIFRMQPPIIRNQKLIII